ncbi:MAG: 3-deoxy-manno-octulosonate cytidylyltransferase [Planctomycetota bacterium]
MNALALIPARYASTRLPGKPLLSETGKPLIQHVVEQVQRASRVDRVAVATDDDRIADTVRSFGGEAIMTGEHPNGTSRLAEALTVLGTDHELIVNVQGDEPEIDPAVIDALIEGLARNPDTPMATLCSAFGPDEDPNDPNLVKVVKDRLGRALYFSRSRMPYDREGEHPVIWKHPGLYAYRRAFLLDYPSLKPTPLEQAERLEQLRVLEHGHRIALIEADAPHPGIDTRAQYDAFLARCRAQN